MKKMIRRLLPLLPVIAAAFVLAFAGITRAQAKDLDEILSYVVTVDLNSDASLNINYKIDWKVLDSDSEGPLEWIHIGVPNSHYEMLSTSSNISSWSKYASSEIRLDFDRAYKAGETISFEFTIHQEYMFSLDDNQAIYDFTPGWFKDCKTDKLVIRWSTQDTLSKDPAAIEEDGYYIWETSLAKNQRFTVRVTYDASSNPAYDFSMENSKESPNYGDYDDSSSDAGDILAGIVGFIVFIFMIIAIGGIIINASNSHYNSTASLAPTTQKKITRTKVEYYPTCPGCGAPRPEGKENCEYCGRSFIKSEETIEEKDIPKEETALKNQETDGTYRYSSSPNTYMRVHVINVPVSRPSKPRSSCFHSSCAHSSCACASHCACACACACAGGGRAGCSTKDFYNTGVKMRYFERLAEEQKKKK